MQLDLVETDHGCLVPTSHKLDKDGYFHRRVPGGGGKREFYHRYVFRKHHGLDEIPEGFEIDHMCSNRACCNVGHLQMLPREIHKSETARETHARKKAMALMFWRWTDCNSSGLGDMFKVSAFTAERWIDEWSDTIAMIDVVDTLTEG
jgi:hypothetical protein